MKLHYFRGDPPNFGDELNAAMWTHLLPPGLLDQDPSTLVLGIGSILQNDYPAQARKIVLGSGYGGYTGRPAVQDGSWDIRFVRGPQTAEALGLDRRLAITDAAVLLRATPLPAPAKGIEVAFMPHFRSVERGNWQRVCALAGVHFLDPTRPAEALVAEIRGARLVITEAMHGAIVADAMRTPWIGVKTMHHLHRYKWSDWARSLAIHYRPMALMPSSGREAWALTTGRWGSGPRARAVFDGPAGRPVNLALIHLAARSMERLARSEPTLSGDAEIETATERALEAVEGFVRSYARPRIPA